MIKVNVPITRRDFLKRASQVGVAFAGLQSLTLQAALAADEVHRVGYGPLTTDPYGIINLPSGFTYQVISNEGDKMNDGFYVPGNPDGMATFRLDRNRLVLIRNHEVALYNTVNGPFGFFNGLLDRLTKDEIYDYGSGIAPGLGGTTSVVYNELTRQAEFSYLSLAGTIRNCAGGATPWGSWLSCEETVQRPDGVVEKDHGYVFEVPASAMLRVAQPIPLKAMGRFNHEAAAVDPRTGIVYLTEDRGDGLFYRFIPKTPGVLRAGGRLQALSVIDGDQVDVRNQPNQTQEGVEIGQVLDCLWIDIEDVESPDDSLRHQGYNKGATRFLRGEGIWFGDDELYFTATKGGIKQAGQVFRYRPSPFEGQENESDSPGQLDLFIEPNDTSKMKYCDNLTIAPWGDLILCEDDPHPFIVGVTPEGRLYHLAENIGYSTEFAGACFSPSGKTFFVNIQGAGKTLAIQGPWHSL